MKRSNLSIQEIASLAMTGILNFYFIAYRNTQIFSRLTSNA